jgi:hypothetical protein
MFNINPYRKSERDKATLKKWHELNQTRLDNGLRIHKNNNTHWDLWNKANMVKALGIAGLASAGLTSADHFATYLPAVKNAANHCQSKQSEIRLLQEIDLNNSLRTFQDQPKTFKPTPDFMRAQAENTRKIKQAQRNADKACNQDYAAAQSQLRENKNGASIMGLLGSAGLVSGFLLDRKKRHILNQNTQLKKQMPVINEDLINIRKDTTLGARLLTPSARKVLKTEFNPECTQELFRLVGKSQRDYPFDLSHLELPEAKQNFDARLLDSKPQSQMPKNTD